MRVLIALALLLAALWSVFWWYGAAREEAALRDWFGTRSGGDLVTRGFPNRFDTTVPAPQIAAGPVHWSAPFLQLLRLSYSPGHYIVVFPPEQTLAISGHDLALTASDARASVVLDGAALDHSALVFADPRLSGDAWTLTAAQLRFATQRRADEGVHRVGLDLPGLALDAWRTDLHVEGDLTLDGGAPRGTLSVTAGDPAALAAIAAALGVPALATDRLIFEGGAVYAGDGTRLGPAPRLSPD